MNEKMPELKVPGKCRNCPNVLRAIEDINECNGEVDKGIMLAVSDDPEKMSEGLLAIAHKIGLEDENEPSAEQLAGDLRSLVSQKVEGLTAQADGIRTDVEAFALGCLGVLTMRGSRDGRRDVTVTICQSPRIDDGTQRESAIVTRSLRE